MNYPGYPDPNRGQYFGGMPPTYTGAPQPAGRPREVERAFWLWVAAIVVNIASGVLNLLVYAPRIQQQVLHRMQGTPGVDTGELTRSLSNVSGTSGIAGIVITTALWVLFVVMMRQGRNWARITLLVITCLWALSQVLSIVVSAAISLVTVPVLTTVLAAVILVLSVIACVLMFRPQVRHFFAGGPTGNR